MPRGCGCCVRAVLGKPVSDELQITGSLRQFWPDAPPPKQNFFDDVPELLARGQHI
jgi:hypothetical protein